MDVDRALSIVEAATSHQRRSLLANANRTLIAEVKRARGGPSADAHDYLSTSCLHGHHDHCAAMVGTHGEKRPATCKFCAAQCICPCHTDPGATT